MFLMISLAGHFQIQTAGGRPRRVLLFAAQFGGAGFRHIPRLGCYSAHISLFEGWVWPGLWGCVACWNCPHIFLQSAAPKAKGNCCYWRHNSQGSLFRTWLLLTTQLGVQTGCGGPVGWGCCSLHILKRGVPAGCFPGFCTQDCYSAHIFSLPMCPYLSQYR